MCTCGRRRRRAGPTPLGTQFAERRHVTLDLEPNPPFIGWVGARAVDGPDMMQSHLTREEFDRNRTLGVKILNTHNTRTAGQDVWTSSSRKRNPKRPSLRFSGPINSGCAASVVSRPGGSGLHLPRSSHRSDRRTLRGCRSRPVRGRGHLPCVQVPDRSFPTASR